MNKNKLIILGSALLLLLVLSYFDPLTLWDENAYLGNARSHIANASYTENFRYPLLEFIVAGAWKITGESIFVARIIAILFYLGTVYLFYLLSKKYFKKNELLTIFFAFSPLMIYWGFRVYTDIPSLFFIMLSFYFMDKSYLLAGIAGGLGFVTRFTAVLYIGAITLYLFSIKKIKKSFVYLCGVAIIIIPWLIRNYVLHGNPIWDFMTYNSMNNIYNTFKSPLPFLLDLIIYGNIFLIILIIAIRKLVKNDKFRAMLIYISVYIIYIAFISHVKESRYIIGILPFVFILGWSGIMSIKKKNIRNTLILAIAVISFCLLINTLFSINREFYCDRNSSILQTIHYFDDEHNINIISNVWPWFGYYNNFGVHAIYMQNITELINENHPKYFVYTEGRGDPFNETLLNSTLHQTNQFFGICRDVTTIYST